MTKKQEHEVLFNECYKNYKIVGNHCNDDDEFYEEYRVKAITLDLVIHDMGLSNEFDEWKREQYKKENA